MKVVEIFERCVGKRFQVIQVAVADLRGQVAAATDPMQKSFAGLMLSYASATAINMSPLLRQFHVRRRSVEEYARSVTQSASLEAAILSG